MSYGMNGSGCVLIGGISCTTVIHGCSSGGAVKAVSRLDVCVVMPA